LGAFSASRLCDSAAGHPPKGAEPQGQPDETLTAVNATYCSHVVVCIDLGGFKMHSNDDQICVGMMSDGSMPDRAQWPLDPTALALTASASTDGSAKPDVLCPEIGRRLLLAQLQFSNWVLRRVEKVQFERERSVSRRLTIEFLIRADAPIFVRDGKEFWLVPISIMQRRTLVNLDLRDERGESVSLPGLRLNQQLDQSVLLAAAAATVPDSMLPCSPGRMFIQTVIAGRKHEIEAAFDEFENNAAQRPGEPDLEEDYLSPLRRSPLFTETLYRLRRNFTLYLFLPVERGRHRLLRMSFDEPTSWKYQTAELKVDPSPPQGLRHRATEDDLRSDPATKDVWHYQAGYRASRWHGFSSAIGLTPTKIRFQVPSAEHAASYHFEATAPLGLRIVRATLIAGRPNNPRRHVSADHQEGHSPIIGLHATGIPFGSLCRAQVELRLPTGGWLTTLWMSCWLICAVLTSVAWHWARGFAASWNADQATNICVLLVSTSAGVVAVLAQREFGGLAARLLVWMRAVGLLAIALPVVMAAFLAYSSGAPTPTQSRWQESASYVTSGAAGLIALYVTLVWLLSKRAEWRVDAVDRQARPRGGRRFNRRGLLRERSARKVKDSPWDMTHPPRGMSKEHAKDQAQIDEDFAKAVHEYKFDQASIGVRSAEGWHEWYAATDESHRANINSATQALLPTGESDDLVSPCRRFGSRCVRQAR
jgi:hypothetical protein